MVPDVLRRVEHSEGQTGQEVPRGQESANWSQRESCAFYIEIIQYVKQLSYRHAGTFACIDCISSQSKTTSYYIPFRNSETSCKLGIFPTRYPQFSTNNGNTLLNSLHACVGYNFVSSVNILLLQNEKWLSLEFFLTFSHSL